VGLQFFVGNFAGNFVGNCGVFRFLVKFSAFCAIFVVN